MAGSSKDSVKCKVLNEEELGPRFYFIDLITDQAT